MVRSGVDPFWCSHPLSSFWPKVFRIVLCFFVHVADCPASPSPLFVVICVQAFRTRSRWWTPSTSFRLCALCAVALVTVYFFHSWWVLSLCRRVNSIQKSCFKVLFLKRLLVFFGRNLAAASEKNLLEEVRQHKGLLRLPQGQFREGLRALQTRQLCVCHENLVVLHSVWKL